MQVFGEVQPYSITGSLPLVRSLQDNDYDVQLVGYGLSSKCVGCSLECYMVCLGWEWMVPIQQRGKGPTDPMVQNRTLSQHTHTYTQTRYHADNEAADLKDFKRALKILARVIAKMEQTA